MHITDCSGDLFSKCAVGDKFNAAWFLHATLICPFVILKLKESARLHALSRARKKCDRGFLHRLHLLLSTLADLEVLSLHDWQQENSLWFGMTVWKRCESGWCVFTELLFCIVRWSLVSHNESSIVHSTVSRNQFSCCLQTCERKWFL